MNHADLVITACRWLRSTKKCKPVYGEIVTAEAETPDAIGWTGFGCHVVECKTSRADMKRDAKKPHRVTGRGMGTYRWILSPKGVLRPEDVPEDHGWIETLTGKRVHITRPAPGRGEGIRDAAAEVRILRSAIRRHEVGAVWEAKRFRWVPVTVSGG